MYDDPSYTKTASGLPFFSLQRVEELLDCALAPKTKPTPHSKAPQDAVHWEKSGCLVHSLLGGR